MKIPFRSFTLALPAALLFAGGLTAKPPAKPTTATITAKAPATVSRQAKPYTIDQFLANTSYGGAVVFPRRPQDSRQLQPDRGLQRLRPFRRRRQARPAHRLQGERHSGGGLLPQRRAVPLPERPGREREKPSLRPVPGRHRPRPDAGRQAARRFRGLGTGREGLLSLYQRARSCRHGSL